MFRFVYSVLLATLFFMPSISQAQLVDAIGDAQDILGEGGTLFDIHTLDLESDGTNLHFDLTFDNPTNNPLLLTDVNVSIGLDTDQNAQTGRAPFQNFLPDFFPTLDSGVELDLILEGIGSSTDVVIFGNLLDATDESLVASVDIVFTADSISGYIPLTVLGDDDGLVDFSIIAGSNPQPTDAGGLSTSTVAVPEPSSLVVLMGLGLGGVFFRRGREN